MIQQEKNPERIRIKCLEPKKYEVFKKKEAACVWEYRFNPLSANPTKWSNTFQQFVG